MLRLVNVVQMSGINVGCKLLSERGHGGRGMNFIWKSISNSWSIKIKTIKTITKLFDRFMSRKVELCNDKEIAATLCLVL